MFNNKVIEKEIKEQIAGYFYFSTEGVPLPSEMEELTFEEIINLEYYRDYIEEVIEELEDEIECGATEIEEAAKSIIKKIVDYANEDEIGYSCVYFEEKTEKEKIAPFPENYFEKVYAKFDYFGNVANIINRKYKLEIIDANYSLTEEEQESISKYEKYEYLRDDEKREVRAKLLV